MAGNVRFPLLLLLGLFAMLSPLWAVPPGFTPFRWFAVQHVHPNPLTSCNGAMRGINQNLPHGGCKPTNTFLHDSSQNVIHVCTLANIPCKNRRYNNCHQSASPVNMTVCRLIRGSTPPNCRYTNRNSFAGFTVACNSPQAGDPLDPLVPVHLD
ncbi:Ribonuclease K6 [Fukomys damarensis]|uniref:Ribonuclease K6 n=2 Tax=Fukomys damarensis TaxID=885580 RepID=A0A091DBD6_FUKDA|nr:Ribonuclease K6 [Fukomys damarensis]